MPNFSRRCLIQSTAALGASLAAPGLLRAQNAIRDTDFVRMALEAVHPGLYRYQTPGEFVLRHKAFAERFTESNFDGKVLALQSLLAQVRCGHTYINPANQTADIRKKLYGSRRALPFHFRWIEDRMVVTGDPHAIGLAPGSVIESIDQWLTKDVLKWLLPLARVDGNNAGKRRALMSVTGGERWPMFDLYFDLLFKPGENVTLSATDPDGAGRVLKVGTISNEQRIAASSDIVNTDPEAPIWSSRSANDGKTKIITMPSWVVYKTKWNWLGWLRGELGGAMMDGSSGLVFDLRGNEGGTSIGEGMLPFLLREPISIPQPQELVRFREAPAQLRPQFKTWDSSFYTIGKDGKAVEDGFIEIKPARSQTIKPLPQTFKGKIAVLINADNSSATFLFAQALRAAGVATLIGETTGGNRRGINGGAYFFTRLPESGIEFDIPLIGYYPAGEQPDAGLEPDIAIAPSAADIAAGRDRAMERALEVVA